MTDPKLVLMRLRSLLRSVAIRDIVRTYHDPNGPRLCLPAEVGHPEVDDLIHGLDALITGTERDYLATDRDEAMRQVCAMDDLTVRELLVDLLAQRLTRETA